MTEPLYPTRIRIALQNAAFEVEGSEAFVTKYSTTIDSLIERLSDGASKRTSGSGSAGHTTEDSDWGEFPEALHQVRGKSATDQILVAGFYAALANGNGIFSTGDANKLLVGQGIKLPNPSQSLANNLKNKRVFKQGKDWKVSKQGEEELGALLRHGQ